MPSWFSEKRRAHLKLNSAGSAKCVIGLSWTECMPVTRENKICSSNISWLNIQYINNLHIYNFFHIKSTFSRAKAASLISSTKGFFLRKKNSEYSSLSWIELTNLIWLILLWKLTFDSEFIIEKSGTIDKFKWGERAPVWLVNVTKQSHWRETPSDKWINPNRLSHKYSSRNITETETWI